MASSLEQAVREQTCTGVADKATDCARARRTFCVTTEKKKRPKSQTAVPAGGLSQVQPKLHEACPGMRRTQNVRHEHLFTAEWHPGGCKKRCVKEKTHKPTDPPLQPEAREIVVMAAVAETERARAPERAAPKHISTCGQQKKVAATNQKTARTHILLDPVMRLC